MSFEDRLQERIRKANSRLCVGLDPRPQRISGDVESFLQQLVERVADQVAAFKPNIAYFEAMGPDGYRMLEELLERIPAGVPVILDVKRSDIPETQKYYARAYFERWDVDAVTLNPYLGRDSLEPFLKYPDRGVYLLGVTSNPGARDLQMIKQDGQTLFERVARMAESNTLPATAGLVLGLTNLTGEMVRDLPDVPLLIPGLGAQGGAIEQLAGTDRSAPLLINSSRSVMYAEGEDGPRRAARDYRERINHAIG